MIEILLTVIPSVCWMIFRCYQLLHTPADRLARQLNVDVPHTPSVCVDQLGSTHLVLHWDIEILPDENIFYVVLVNGKDAGTLAQTSVKLCNLEPDSLYRVQVLAVNAISNFRSQSPAVYVHTQPKKVAGGDHKLKLPFAVAREVELPSSFHETLSTNFSLDLTAAEAAKVSDKAVLSEYLYVFQNELSRVVHDIDALSKNQKQEEAKLKNELESYKKELDEGSDVRARKDLDVKGLEKRKDLLTFEKLKLSKQLKNHESHRNLHVNKLNELRAKVGKLQEKRQHVINASQSEKNKVDTKMSAISGDIKSIKEEISSLEQSVKELSNERKEITHMVQALRPLVDQFITPPVNPSSTSDSPNISSTSLVSSAEIFTRESSLTKLGNEVLRKIYSYRADWETDLSREIATLSSLDTSWRHAFRAAIRRFVSTQNAVEVARANQDSSYEPQKITEYQASVEFGGFGNAIAKGFSKKKVILAEDGSASPSPPPEGNDSWVGNHSLVYDDSADLSSLPSTSALNLASSSDQLRNQQAAQPYFTENISVAQDVVQPIPESARTVQARGAYPEILVLNNQYAGQAFGQSTYGDHVGTVNTQPMYADNAYGDHAFADQTYGQQQNLDHQYTQQSYGDNGYAHGAYVDQNYTEPQEESAFLARAYIDKYPESTYHDNTSNQMLGYPDTNGYPVQTQPLVGSTSMNGMQSDFDQSVSNVQTSVQPSSMQQYAQNIRQNFPYEDVYSLRSPTPENYLQPVQNNLWNNLSRNNFLDSRRTFLGLSLLPSSANMELHSLLNHNTVPNSQMVPQVAVPQDNSLFDSILLSPSTSSQLPSSNIWLDRPMTTSYSHNRAISNTSQLWRTEPARSEGSPIMGFVLDFLPFSPIKDSHGNKSNTSPNQGH